MKLDDKQKKWMIIGGAVIVCMILTLLIAGRFKSEPATAVQQTTQADQTTVAEPIIESSEAVRETVKVETKAETTAAPTKDQTDETVQQIQPEVTKPAKPKDEDRHDPAKKPNGETVTPTKPGNRTAGGYRATAGRTTNRAANRSSDRSNGICASGREDICAWVWLGEREWNYCKRWIFRW